MESLDYWRLCDELTIIQASLLIVGEDPGKGSEEYVMGWEHHHRPEGFNAVFAALKAAVNSSTLMAKIVHKGEMVEYHYEGDSRTNWSRESLPDWDLTTINVNNLKEWLVSRGIKTGFFFPNGSDERDYLDKNSPCYAPKLAAAVRSWEAVKGDETRLRGKTPKQALEKFLREHASEYGLTKDDGNPNEQGIEQICKVANWKPEGGAAKTPSPTLANSNLPTPKKLEKNQGFNDFDDEALPF